MAKKWIALNILLLMAVAGLARELYQRYDQFMTKDEPSVVESVYEEYDESQSAEVGTSGDPASADVLLESPLYADADYFIVSERTLFSDKRGRDEALETPVPKSTPLPKPHPILVGTIMMDGQYTAFVVDQQSALQQGRSNQNSLETWNVGANYRGFRVSSITAEQVTLENGTTREIISMNRTFRRAGPQAKPMMASNANVVSVGTLGASSGGLTVSTASASTMMPGMMGRGGQQIQQGQRGQGPQGKPTPAKPQQDASGQQAQNTRPPVTISTPNGNVVLSLPENLQGLLGAAGNTVVTRSTSDAQQPQQQQQRQLLQEQRVVSSPFGDIVRPR